MGVYRPAYQFCKWCLKRHVAPVCRPPGNSPPGVSPSAEPATPSRALRQARPRRRPNRCARTAVSSSAAPTVWGSGAARAVSLANDVSAYEIERQASALHVLLTRNDCLTGELYRALLHANLEAVMRLTRESLTGCRESENE